MSSRQLPYAAHVTLTEFAPAHVEGATGEFAAFRPATVTTGDGSIVELTLTNTITAPRSW